MALDQPTLQATLLGLTPKAWYKRPPDNKMSYPCFVYRLSNPDTKHADNRVYSYTPCYNIIYMSTEPNDRIVRQMLEGFEHCSFDREYQADNIYHYSFVVYWTGYVQGRGEEVPYSFMPITDPEINDVFTEDE